MKKLQIFNSFISLFFLLYQTAEASDKNQFYVGADLIYSRTDHVGRNSLYNSDQGRRRHGGGKSIGVNAGYRINYNMVFVAPEVFYDQLNNTSNDFGVAHTSRMHVNNRYGAKVNLGYKFTPNVSGFVNAGLASVSYTNTAPTIFARYNDRSLAPIYGVGALVKLNDNWALKVAYDYQQYRQRYYRTTPWFKDDVVLRTFKLGAIYSF